MNERKATEEQLDTIHLSEFAGSLLEAKRVLTNIVKNNPGHTDIRLEVGTSYDTYSHHEYEKLKVYGTRLESQKEADDRVRREEQIKKNEERKAQREEAQERALYLQLKKKYGSEEKDKGKTKKEKSQ
jgi:hypothetical protein